MREIHIEEIRKALEEAVVQANTVLPADIRQALERACESETLPRAQKLLQITLENATIAAEQQLAMCQDTGMVVVEIELGQDVHVVGGLMEEAINQGIRDGYERAYFRKSVVSDPFIRINTGDNTPAVIHTHLTAGDQMEIVVFPKGAGSENMCQLVMLKPSQGIQGVKEFVVKVVREASGNPCPPVLVGVGIGGNMEKAALLAKKALLREVGQRHPEEHLASLEEELLEQINTLGIGPQGLGGQTTALDVFVESYPTHIACLPVAVCLGCHATRRVKINL
ncbi:MAG: fumarate hydratase [Bacillota bacterium]|nr:fumarate hydratase [Bacillota bacterium]